MPNSWFRFKQFMIHQDRCAMKVGTDGVLLGALADAAGADDILDIGTGTGLVALMLAQRSHAQIDAVEVDARAAEQAAENIRNSPWAGRMHVILGDFTDFYPSSGKKYDLIVSNPPYFRNSLKPKTREKALARHSSDTFYKHLLEGSARLLRPAGKCWLILPAEITGALEAMAGDVHLHVQGRTLVRSSRGGKVIRQLIALGPGRMETGSMKTKDCTSEELVIYEREKEYTTAFRELVRSYYLDI